MTRYSILANEAGQNLLIWSLTWDTEEDAVEFFDTFQLFMQVFTGATWESEEEGDGTSLLTLSGQVIRASIDKLDTRLVFAPDTATLDLALAAVVP